MTIMTKTKPALPLKSRACHKALARLASKNALTPDNLVAEARDPDNPWHPYFDWNDDTAAHQHRLNQARIFINSYQIKIVVAERTFRVQEYVRDPLRNSREQGYTPIIRLRDDETSAIIFIERELKIAKTYVDKTLAEAKVLGLYKDVEHVSNELARIVTTVKKRVHKVA
jgi:hypothetical protein